ncbi:MAG: hypothetical protein WC073_13420 [Sterolibacterium sp.]
MLKEKIKVFFSLALLASMLGLAACGGGGGGGAQGTIPPVAADAAPAVADLSLTASSTTVKSDNSNLITITVSAVSAGNAAIPDVVVALSADTGILSTPTVKTGAAGSTTPGSATFTFSSGSALKANRTATITASTKVTQGPVITRQFLVQITGSTLSVTASGTSVTAGDPNSAVVMTFWAKDAGGNPIEGAQLNLSQTSTTTGAVTISPIYPASGKTAATTADSLPYTITSGPATGKVVQAGQLVVAVKGTSAGAVTIKASSPLELAPQGTSQAPAVGAATPASADVVVASTPLLISKTSLNGVDTHKTTEVAMKIGDSLEVEATDPNPGPINFATTLGTLKYTDAQGAVHTGNPLSVPLNSGCTTNAANKACATLTTTQAGLSSVQAYDATTTSLSASLAVWMTSVNPNKITVQASPSLVAKSMGGTIGVSTLTVTVKDALDQPVGDQPVALTIVNPTGGGETISPVVVFTASTATSTLGLGQALATFTSGSLPTGAQGVQIRAQIPGTATPVATHTAPSGDDATIVIGGTAASVAFGQATTLSTTTDGANYISSMSVLVTDANGNPAPAGTVVNLSAWPIAWSTGGGCIIDADTATTGTFYNEDANENLFMDTNADGTPKEDGVRKYYYGTLPDATGTRDGKITPSSSEGGTVPGTVVVGSDPLTGLSTGLASFNLVYPKTSALWTVTRLRARTVVQGSETLSEYQFRLPASIDDYNMPMVCKIPNSHNRF